MKQILSFTDGSRYAASVYDHTAWAAEKLGAKVRVIHTLNPHREKAALADLSGSMGVDTHAALMAELVKFDAERARVAQIKGQAIVKGARQHLEGKGLAEVAAEMRHGFFIDILDALHEEMDLIVIGKRGTNATIDMKHLGTNIERALRVAHRPVLVASREFKPIERFVLAYDGAAASEKALAYALSEPLLQGTKCLLLRVGSDNARNRSEMEAAAGLLKSAGYKVEMKLLEGEPAKVITREVEEGGQDLLVMGGYGHSKAKRLLIGSTTATLARDCHVPILMFR